MPFISKIIPVPNNAIVKEINGPPSILATMSQDREFNIEGTMRKGPRRIFFRQTLEAPNEKMAMERAYALIGSRHRAKRNQIKFSKIEEKKGP